MEKVVPFKSIDLLYHQMRYALNSLYAVHCAMDEGTKEPEEFLDGLFGVAEHFDFLLDELKEVYDPEDGRAKSCLL